MSTEQCKNKMKQTNRQKYGVDWVFQSNAVKDKIRTTVKSKYNADWYSKSEDYLIKSKNTNLKKYGVDHIMKDSIYKKKRLQKINQHKTELECFEYLKTLFKTVYRDHKSDKYPFKCDFYVEDIDTYIELNFFIVHGNHKFDENNKNDIIKLQNWKEKAKISDFYKRCIDIWTRLDPLKFNIAKQNKLNYLVFYTKQDFYKYFYNLQKGN